MLKVFLLSVCVFCLLCNRSRVRCTLLSYSYISTTQTSTLFFVTPIETNSNFTALLRIFWPNKELLTIIFENCPRCTYDHSGMACTGKTSVSTARNVLSQSQVNVFNILHTPITNFHFLLMLVKVNIAKVGSSRKWIQLAPKAIRVEIQYLHQHSQVDHMNLQCRIVFSAFCGDSTFWQAPFGKHAVTGKRRRASTENCYSSSLVTWEERSGKLSEWS